MSYKILYITNRCPFPVTDGQSRRTLNILKRIGKDNSITLIALDESGGRYIEESTKVLKNSCHKVLFVDAPKKRISLEMISRLLLSQFSLWPYTIWRHLSFKFLHALTIELRNNTYDIIHCDNFPIAYVHGLVKNRPTIFTDHDVTFLKVQRLKQNTSNLLFKLFFHLEFLKTKRYERKMIGLFDRTVVVSDNDKQILQKINSTAKISIIDNGVDTKEIDCIGKSEINDTLIWIGGFKHIPNEEAVYQFYTQCYSSIKKKNPNVKFLIIGASPSNRLLRCIKNDPSIVHLPYVDSVSSYLNMASVFVAPILSGSGTKLKVLEAMAAGKCVITTDVGAEGIEGIDNTHFVIAKNDDEFIAYTEELLSNERKRHSIGKEARRLIIEKYEWDSIVKKLFKLHDQLISEVSFK